MPNDTYTTWFEDDRRTAGQLRWTVQNALQFLFLCFWSALWITLALVVLCLTFDRERSVSFARRFWAPPLLKMSQATMDVQGFEGLDLDKPHVYVFNHESLIDTTVAFYSVPQNIRFVAKKEVAYIPFIGWYAWGMGFVFVDRKNHERAVRSMAAAAKLVRDGVSVMVFAEGTRSRDGTIQPFKKGAFVLAIEAGVPVVPVTICGSRDLLPCDGFRIRPATVRVRAGKPIPTTDLSIDDRDELIRQARDAIIDMHVEAGGRGGDRDRAIASSKPAHQRAA